MSTQPARRGLDRAYGPCSTAARGPGALGTARAAGATRPGGRARLRGMALALALLCLCGGLAAQQQAGAAPRARHEKPPRLGACAAGEMCLWAGDRFRGDRRTYELSDVSIESCVPLPAGTDAASFANRTGRPVTVYQSRECAETGEFNTYPSGSWTPEGRYRVRALKIWER